MSFCLERFGTKKAKPYTQVYRYIRYKDKNIKFDSQHSLFGCWTGAACSVQRAACSVQRPRAYSTRAAATTAGAPRCVSPGKDAKVDKAPRFIGGGLRVYCREMAVLSPALGTQLIVMFLLVKVVFRHLLSPLELAARGLLFWVPLVEKNSTSGLAGASVSNSSQGHRNKRKKKKKQGKSNTSFPLGLRQRELTAAEVLNLSHSTEVDWLLQSITGAFALFACTQATNCIFTQTPAINISMVALTVAVLLFLAFLARDLSYSDMSTLKHHGAVGIVSFVALMFCLQLPSSALDLHVKQAIPVLRGRFQNVATSLTLNETSVEITTQRIDEATRSGVQKVVTDMEWLIISTSVAFAGAIMSVLMVKPATLSAKIFRHTVSAENVRPDAMCGRVGTYFGFFLPLLMVVCWIPPMTRSLLFTHVDEHIWHSFRVAFVILCGAFKLVSLRGEVQMHLDAIRPAFANHASARGKVSATGLCNFVMHRIHSLCPVILALVSVAAIPMALAMILKEVAGIPFLEISGFHICPSSIAKAAGATSGGENDAGSRIVQQVFGPFLDEERMERLDIIWKSSSIGFVLHPILEPVVSFLLFVCTGSLCVLSMLEASINE